MAQDDIQIDEPYVAPQVTPERLAQSGDISSLIGARCVALPGKLIDCPVCGAVDNERRAFVGHVAKQSSARMSSIAATYLAHADPNVRSLAASVLSQDETKGQAAPVRPGLTKAEPVFPDDPHMHRQDVAQPLDLAPLQTIAETSVTPLDRQAEALADATEAEAVALAEEVVSHPALARRQSVREPVIVEPRPAPGELRNGHENLRGPGFEE